jgi:hypothetical protein
VISYRTGQNQQAKTVYSYNGDFVGHLFEKGTEIKGNYAQSSEGRIMGSGDFVLNCEGITTFNSKNMGPKECCSGCSIF